MKKKMPLSESILYGAILFVLLQIFMNKNGDSYQSYIADASTNSYSGTADDSIRDHWNRVIADSIKQISNCYEEPALQNDPWLYRLFPRFIKINEANKCDSSTGMQYKYFAVLPGYRLETGTKFYIDKGQYFFYTPDPAMKDTSSGQAALTNKKSDLRFSTLYAKDIGLATQPGYLLIPIKEKSFRTATTCIYVVAALLALYAIWILLVLPVRMLYSIPQKKIFSLENVRYCAVIGWSLIAFAVLTIVIGVILYFSFKSVQPDVISFFVKDIADEINGILLAGLLVLVLKRILEQGYLSQLHKQLSI